MKKYSLKQLYKTLGQAIKDLPFEITYHGSVVAVVRDPASISEKQFNEITHKEQSVKKK
jgi:hypothetical protein